MTEASQPIKKDTAPPEIRKLAEKWLYVLADHEPNAFAAALDIRQCASCAANELMACRCPIPDEWVGALADEMMSAIIDSYLAWSRTLIQGRPLTQPLVEWEHRELDDRPQDAAEMRAEMTR